MKRSGEAGELTYRSTALSSLSMMTNAADFKYPFLMDSLTCGSDVGKICSGQQQKPSHPKVDPSIDRSNVISYHVVRSSSLADEPLRPAA